MYSSSFGVHGLRIGLFVADAAADLEPNVGWISHEYLQRTRSLRDLWHHLDTATPSANDSNLLASPINIPIPVRRMS